MREGAARTCHCNPMMLLEATTCLPRNLRLFVLLRQIRDAGHSLVAQVDARACVAHSQLYS